MARREEGADPQRSVMVEPTTPHSKILRRSAFSMIRIGSNPEAEQIGKDGCRESERECLPDLIRSWMVSRWRPERYPFWRWNSGTCSFLNRQISVPDDT